jgi:hypothetical protein
MKKAAIPAVAVEDEIYEHKLIHLVTPELFSDLDRSTIHEWELALLPVGWGSGDKGPMLQGWPTHRGFTVDHLMLVGGIRSVGTQTGICTVPLLCFDIDVETAGELAVSIFMVAWSVMTWQVHRESDPFRLRPQFRPTLEQIKQLTNGEEYQGKTLAISGDGSRKAEALEVLFHGGHQVMVIGDHPCSDDNYSWPDGLDRDSRWAGSAALCSREIRPIEIPTLSRAMGAWKPSHEPAALDHTSACAVTSKSGVCLAEG